MTERRTWQDCLREAVCIMRNQDRSIWEQRIYDGLRIILANVDGESADK